MLGALRNLAVLLLIWANATAAQPAHANEGRPVVLLVHGRGQFGRDTAELRREAVQAIQQSVAALTGDALVADDDVRLVWYADVLDARAHDQSDVCASRATGSPSKSDTLVNAVTMFASLASAFFDVVSDEAKGRDANELRSLAADMRFFGDPGARCAAEDRVAAALANAERQRRPVILMAHSLGALVSWQYLLHRDPSLPRPYLSRWITLGSPLGSAEVRQLLFGDAEERLTLPLRVGSWVNVVGDGDPFASTIAARRDPTPEPRMLDVITESAHDDPHQLLSYLTDPATGTRAGRWVVRLAVRSQRVARLRVTRREALTRRAYSINRHESPIRLPPPAAIDRPETPSRTRGSASRSPSRMLRYHVAHHRFGL